MIAKKEANKLIQAVFSMWKRANQTADIRRYIAVNTDIGFLVTDSYTAVRIPEYVEHPFKSGRPEPFTVKWLYEYFKFTETAQQAFRLNDIRLLPPDGKMAMCFTFDRVGQEPKLYVDLTKYKMAPAGVSYDVLASKMLRVYVEGEKLPVVVLASLRVRDND